MEKQTKYWIIGIVVLLVALISLRFIVPNKSAAPTISEQLNIDPMSLPGVQNGAAPWQPEVNSLSSRMGKIGLRLLTSEGTALHIHQHLDISINGKPVLVPAGIGIEGASQLIAPVHTHDGTGVIHVESDVTQDFTLGNFFDIWGVRFTDSCLGGYCNTSGKTLSVFVNGQRIGNNFRDVVLKERREIFVYFGDSKSLPPVPTTYSFGPDL